MDDGDQSLGAENGPGEIARGGGGFGGVTTRTVQAVIPVDPPSGFWPGLRPWVIGHDVRVPEQGRHIVEVARGHVAEGQPGREWVHSNGAKGE